ncbi:MAG: T9SS type A sorting domain-containing protein [Flavobacteriaceae bacterium]
MRNLYLILLLVIPTIGLSQEKLESQNEPTEIVAFKLYPNPTYETTVYIESGEKGPKEIMIYDVFGELVLSDRILGEALDISSLSPGVYVLRMAQNNKATTRKLVVK